MNINYKLKSRHARQLPTNCRIKTQCNQNTKINFYLNNNNKGTKNQNPLNENKRIVNQSEHQAPIIQQHRRQKTTTFNNTNNHHKNPRGTINNTHHSKNEQIVSKMTTQINESKDMNHGHRIAIQKIFNAYNNKTPIENKNKQNNTKQSARLTGLSRYQFENKVGSGTFGIVHKVRDRRTLEMVAIKRVYQDRKYKNRQLEILKILEHPNVLKMRDSFFTYEGQKQYLNVVMDYYPMNLYDCILKYKNKIQIPRLKLKVFAYQLFRSLLYLKKISIAHRDIKPQNILINQENWKLIMCDFGSAKKLQIGQTNIAYICSRCYRAPQLIFGNTTYSTQIDVWSAGCVLIQMITMQPIFRADSNIDQLVEIIRVLGTPSYTEILQMNPDCDYNKYQLPKIGHRSWQKILKRKNLGSQFYELLSLIMKYSPKKRIEPLQILQHSFFDEIKRQEVYYKLKKQFNIPDLFNFTETQQASATQLSKLIPDWYEH